MDRRQVGHVAGAVGDERRFERPPRPVGARVGLGDLDAEERLDEARVAHLRRLAGERRRHLGIEDPRRQAPVTQVDDLEILLGRVDHPQSVGEQQVPERAEVESRELVDAEDGVARRDLDEAEAGGELRRAHELGVERDERGGSHRGDGAWHGVLAVDEQVGDIRGWHNRAV